MIGQKNLRICRDCLDSIRFPSFFLNRWWKRWHDGNSTRRQEWIWVIIICSCSRFQRCIPGTRYVSRPVSSQVNLCILCKFMTKNFQDHLPVRVAEPLIKARKDLREKGEKAEETTCQWSGFWYFSSTLYDRPWKRAWWSFDMIKEYTWYAVICEFVVSGVFATRSRIRKAWPTCSWWTWTRLSVL